MISSMSILASKFKSYFITFSGAMALVCALAPFARGQMFSDWSAPINLGPAINTPAIDGCPFISKDGLVLYFASNRTGGTGLQDIYISERSSIQDPWGAPQNIGVSINSGSNEVCPTLSTDGHRLYLVSDSPGGCGGQDLYVSRRHDKRDNFGWEPPVNLGCTVNSPQNDFTPSLFEDENGVMTLYFSSSRPGGPAGTNIYGSTEEGAEGIFGPPVLVAELNTESDDQRPNVRRDGLEIFFDSNRPGSSGSDLWTATRASTGDPWSTPMNVGPIINSTSMEGRPSLSFDGMTLYFMSNRLGGFGNLDLYVTTRSKLRGFD